MLIFLLRLILSHTLTHYVNKWRVQQCTKCRWPHHSDVVVYCSAINCYVCHSAGHLTLNKVYFTAIRISQEKPLQHLVHIDKLLILTTSNRVLWMFQCSLIFLYNLSSSVYWFLSSETLHSITLCSAVVVRNCTPELAADSWKDHMFC